MITFYHPNDQYSSKEIRDVIDHWIDYLHFIREEHFFHESYIVLELRVEDHIDHSHLHFYFRNVREK